MKKLLVIIKREYLNRLRTKSFIISTLLGPLIIVSFAVVPGLLFSLRTGGATKVAVVDETGRMYDAVRESLLRRSDDGGNDAKRAADLTNAPPNDREAQMRKAGEALESHYEVTQVATDGRTLDEVKADLNGRGVRGELDVYLIIPKDILEQNGKVEYHARNLSDLITKSQVQDRLNRAVIEQRMRDANIDSTRVRELNREAGLSEFKIKEGAEERGDGGSSFGLAMFVGLFIYMGILMYGQVILSSVVEEKTTRISEVLFSSVRAFHLMMGKLIGVSLVAITQYAIWALLFGAFTLYGIGMLASSGMDVTLPRMPFSFFIYALLFFIVGFLMYATIYVLVGSMVTTEKEAGQMVMPLIFLSVISIYMAFPVIRNPNSTFAFWVSIAPFFSPITMLVRIVTETPPLWQIALSLGVGLASVVLFVWAAARIYRVGMLMYGKSASIPEVLRWLRQA
ncbi:MAG TPA: ABC transporter permease [Pyrinomonadaceae bacterium]|nr:ABC transporter permease [Pyrinomonadaceae bacterium]